MFAINKSTNKGMDAFRLPIAFAISLHILVLIRTGWIHEDAFITFRAIRNFLDGFGPVWHIGERVQVFTHPLWMFSLSGIIGLTGEYYYTVIFISILLATATMLVIVFCHASNLTTVTLVILLLTLSKAYVDYSTSGLENVLTHLLLVLFYLVYFQYPQTARTLLIATLLAVFGILNRMDIGLIYLPALLYLWYRVGLWRGIYPMIVGSLPLLLWEVFSIIYYGFPFPNTAYAKLETGVESIVYLQKGLLYLLHSTGPDPITGAVIGIGLIMALSSREWRARWLGVGIMFYLIYIVCIGGDYMIGRFLTAPFVVSVVYLTRCATISWSQASSGIMIILVILLGMMSPSHSPIFSGEDYNLRGENDEGISDERSWYYSTLGLLTTTRLNRTPEMGYIQGHVRPEDLATGGIGRFGFFASTHANIVDWVGLSDPLIARIPAQYDPEWRIGHPLRVVPDGYLVTRRSGKNMLVDPGLATYYDKLQLIVKGELWDRERLREIWRFNIGEYEHLIDRERYRYMKRVEHNLTEVTRNIAETISLPESVSFNPHGILINLDEVSHTSLLEIGINSDRFTLIYKLNKFSENKAGEMRQQVYIQQIQGKPIQLGETIYHIISVPEIVVEAGYTAIHLRPDYGDDFTLTFFDLFEWQTGKDQLHLGQLAELYFYQYYLAQRITRDEWLPQIFAEMQKFDQAAWQRIEREKIFDMLLVPDLVMNEFMLTRMPANMLLTDTQGTPMLRYLGMTDSPDSNRGIKLNFDFEVLTRAKEEYSFWFHISPLAEEPSQVIYDYFPEPHITEWLPGNIKQVEAYLKVEPGAYEVSFGFWTRERERLYVDVEQDVHWINLGILTLPETDPEE